MEYLGLIFEFIFLAAGIYLYIFASGKLTAKNSAVSEKSEEFRKANGGWLRILSLGLMAVMIINIILHIQQIWSI